MVSTCRTIADKVEFQDATVDFIEPMADDDLDCAMNICGFAENVGWYVPQDTCTPKSFKCKFGTNFVDFTNFTDSEIAQKRKECAACDDINIEPVGGQGGIIRTPIRDDIEATDVFVRKHGIHRRLKMLWILLGTLMIFLALLVFKRN